jgi:hypothetical protein
MVKMYDIKGNSPLEQQDETKQPKITFDDPDFGGKDSIEFDGSDDVLKRALTQSEKNRLKQYDKGEVFIVATVSETPDEAKNLLSFSDKDSDDNSFQFVGWEGVKNDSIGIFYRDVNGIDLIYGDDALDQNKANVIHQRSDGNNWDLELNGKDQILTVDSGSNSGNWLADHFGSSVTDLDTISMGAVLRSTNSKYREITIAAAYIYAPLTQDERDTITQHLLNKYGI